MRLQRRIDQILWLAFAAFLVVFFVWIAKIGPTRTFAEGTEEVKTAEQAYFVSVFDGGKKLTIRTNVLTVGEALERVGVIINEGDKVEPALDSVINADNYYINIYRARPVILKDGMVERYVMTASYSPAEAFNEAGVVIYDGDEVSAVANRNFLEAGAAMVYEVKRNGGRTLTVEEEIPFTEETVRDYNLPVGSSEVRQLGEVGAKRVTYNVLYVNNEEVQREFVSEEIVRPSVARVVAVGAKPSVRPGTETCAGWAREAGVSEADMAIALDIIYRESGCRVDATNAYSGAYGIPQALPGTKMASAGADWQTNPVTQIRWMIGYVNGRYGGWAQAAEWWYSHGWY